MAMRLSRRLRYRLQAPRQALLWGHQYPGFPVVNRGYSKFGPSGAVDGFAVFLKNGPFCDFCKRLNNLNLAAGLSEDPAVR